MFSSLYLRVGAFAIAFALCTSQVLAQTSLATSAGSISGIVADQVTGLGISDAHVALLLGDRQVSTTDTDSRGRFQMKGVAPGIYRLSAAALSYSSQGSGDVAVIGGQENVVSFVLTREQGSEGKLKTIATARASSRGALAATTTITRTLDPGVLQSEGYTRFGDQLRTLPGMNLGGLSSSVGDDLYLNIRGMGSSETQALLDGHPVGPIGVYAFNGGGNFPSSFNFADSPSFALSKVDVTFGSGSSGLYGNDAIGGTVNMLTLNPTTDHHFEWSYGVGDQGKQLSLAKATGTLGRLGYAFAAGVTGTYGMFAPQQIVQSALPDNAGNPCPAVATQYDLTPCHYAANTYQVSQNVNVKSGIAKLSYALSHNTTFTGSWFGSGQVADSTGNGDNDFLTYDEQLYIIQSRKSPDCALPTDTGGATSGFSATTAAGAQCLTASQLATATSGPNGGGAGRARGTSMFDYHARLQTTDKHSTYTADYFFDHYKFFKTSEDAAGLNPDGTCCAGSVYSQFLNSQGILLSDEIVNENSDFGFGYFAEHQLQTRLNFQFAGQGSYSYTPPQTPGYASVFAKGSLNLNPVFSVYANAWLKKSNVTNSSSFDPRISFVARPKSGRDIYRVTYGHSTGDPAAELVYGTAQLTGNPNSAGTSFACNSYANTEANGVNPGLKPEAANDYELGYAHRFNNDSSVQVNMYQTDVKNQLFSASIPLTQYAGTVPISSTFLAGFAQDAINKGCPGVTLASPSSVLQYIAIATTYNAVSARYRGIEISGHQRLSRNFTMDYAYDIQSAQQSGVTDNILQNNPYIINDHQIFQIPFNQATLAFDYATPQGWQAHMDGYFVSINNVSNRPAYNFWSGYIGKSFGKGMNVRLGAFNIFNQASQMYGYQGHQVLAPENQFFNDTTSAMQGANNGGEEFGLASRSFLLTLSQSF